MKTLETVLSAAIYTSSVLGIQILLMDKWLWTAAPTHAYGLIVFVIADCAVLVAIWKSKTLGIIGATLLSTVQLGAMLGDIVIGQPSRISAASFKSYLLSDTAFISLLVTQGVILLLATTLIATPLAHRYRLVLSQIKRN